MIDKKFVLGNMELKNRLVQAAIYLGVSGKSKDFREFYINIAKGGAGLIIAPQSTGDILNIWHDQEFINIMKNLVNHTHENGAKIVVQYFKDIKDINLVSKDDIKKIIKQYGDTINGIKKSGFDGVELHSAHYSSFAKFLSPFNNKRDDEYGLNNKNGSKFLLDTIIEMRKIDKKFPILVRVSATDFADFGRGVDQTINLCKDLEKVGVTAIDLSAGTMDSPDEDAIFPNYKRENGCYIDYAKKLKTYIKIPIITVGKINTRSLCDKIIKESYAYLIAIGRAAIADNEVYNKILGLNNKAIKECKYCNIGCLKESLFKGEKVYCIRNL